MWGIDMTFTCNKTRECRANNPFGISLSSTYDWDGIDYSKNVPGKNGIVFHGVDNEIGDMLVFFLAWQDGLNAALWLLWDSYFQKGINTPRTIYNEWSGDSEAKAAQRNELSNGAKVAEIMKVSPDLILEFTINSLLPLLQAMLRFEDTTAVFESDLINIPIEMYQNAIEYAQSPDV